MLKRYSSFTLDTANQSILRGGDAIHLTPKAFAVLIYLVENPGRIVTKEELLQAVWADTFVQEAVLKTCVLDIRKALGESPKYPKCIETVHRRGYRFVDAPVEEESEKEPESGAPSHLLGRGEDLHRLRSLLDRAAAGTRQVAFVTGEPGVGKSTLINHFLHTSGVTRVLYGDCVEQFGAREAYYPLFDALTRGARDGSIPGLVDALRTYAPTWLLEMPGVTSAGERETLKLETAGATQDRMLREITEAIESLADREPLIVVLEDLHWSDLPTIDLISRLANRVENARLLLIVSYRPVEVILNNHPVRSLKHGLLTHERCVELELELLSRSDIGEMLSQRFKKHEFPDTFARRVHERTEGNPLFVTNLLDYAVSRGLIAEEDGKWRLKDPDLGVPESLSQMIEQQIELLTPREQQVLEAASVIGAVFPVALLAGEDTVQRESFETCCDGMSKRGLFVCPAGIADYGAGNVSAQFQFMHALYRDVFYRRLSPIQHVRLHRTIGERLEQVFGDRLNEAASELAVHFQECHDSEKAISYLQLVAQRCAARHALIEAADALGKAIKLTDNLPAPRKSVVRLDLIRQLGLVRRLMGQLGPAAAEFERMFAEAPDASNKLRALLELASVASWLNRDRCLQAVDKIVQLCGPDIDVSLRANALGQVAYWNLLFRGWDERDALACQAALDAARAKDDRTAIALHAIRHAYFQTLSSRYREACETARDGIRMAMSFDNLVDYSVGHYFEATALLHLGQWGELRKRLGSAIDMAKRNGHDLWGLLFGLLEAFLHIEASSFDVAREACGRHLARARALEHQLSVQIGLVLLGRAELGAKNLAGARSRFEEVRDWQSRERILMDWIWTLPLQLGFTELCLAEGDIKAAETESARFLEIASQTAERTWIGLAHYALGSVAAAKGDRVGVRSAVIRGQAAIDGFTTPLAEWRLHSLDGRAGLAKAQHVLRGLSDSLPEQDPLKDTLLAASAVVSAPFVADSQSST